MDLIIILNLFNNFFLKLKQKYEESLKTEVIMNMNTYSQYFMVTSCSRHISIINIISDMKIQPSYVNSPAEQ